MIGKCPHCGIDLNLPPINKRETNEVMIVMLFRSKIDNNDKLKPIEVLGYCEICNATIDDLKEQKSNNNP